MFLHRSYIWEKSYSWDMGQNALTQSECRIFKSTISPEQIDEPVYFLACWYKFTKISWKKKKKKLIKFFWLSVVKNRYGQSGLWTLKLTVSNVSKDFLGRPISAGALGGGCDAPLWVQGKAPRNSKYLLLWNHFWLKYTMQDLKWK